MIGAIEKVSKLSLSVSFPNRIGYFPGKENRSSSTGIYILKKDTEDFAT